jgi:hypothetical protein
MPLKVPPRHDLVQPLAHWLDGDEQVGFGNTNNSTNPLQWVVPKPDFSSVDCRSELLRLAALRNCLSESLLDSHESAIQEHHALEDCQDYHATLMEFEKQGFPTLDDELNQIALTWKGAFASKQLETHYSLVWDRSCTLWNVAALQSFVAFRADATTKEGCKVAIAQCQAAASHLALLKQLVEQDDYATVDLSTPMLSFWETLLLAQGQVSIYRMANNNNNGDGGVRQHTTLAYLLQAAASLYNEALQQAKDPRLQSEVPKQSTGWATHCKAQSLICQARAVFHISLDHRQQNQHGLEIARLQQCIALLQECTDFIKKGNYTAPEVDGLVRLATDRCQRAAEENRRVYMEDIPKELPEIRSQLLVKKQLPLAAAMMVSKVPLFTFLKK